MVSDIGLTSLSTGCPALEKLNCAGLYLLADPRAAPYRYKGDKRSEAGEGAAKPTYIGVPAVCRNCSALSSLDLSGCFRLNVALEKHLARHAPTLQKLNLTACNQISSDSLIAIAQGCPILEELILADCGRGVCGASMSALSRGCPLMRSLAVSRCEYIRASAIKAISCFEKLEKLDLTGCASLGDEDVLPLAETDKVLKLRHLSLADCPRITDTGLTWISNGCSSLLLLALKGTTVSRHATRAVRDAFPHSDMVYNANFVGFWPKHQVEDRVLINKYENMSNGLCRMQSKVRGMIAKETVQVLREKRKVEKAILYIQRLARIIIGRNILKKKHLELLQRHQYARKITSLFHMIVAKNKVQRIREARFHLISNAMARKIQRCWFIHVSYLKMLATQASYRLLLDRRYKAATKIQSIARVYFARHHVQILRNHREAHLRLRRRKAADVQRVYRGHVDRETARMLREQNEYVRKCRYEGSVTIQRAWRRHRTRLAVRNAKILKEKRTHCAIKIQAVMRGRLARWEILGILTEIQGNKREWAAIKIQTAWRRKRAYLTAAELKQQAYEEYLRRVAASIMISKTYRCFVAKKLLKQLKFEYDEIIRTRVLAELEAVITIQAAYRGMKGRIRFKHLLRHKKGQWKELFDEEKGKRFFYNKLTGEIRWRIPQDLLDLIPRYDVLVIIYCIFHFVLFY